MQNYKNHVRFYTPHHFVFYPVLLVFLILSGKCIFSESQDRWVYILVTVLAFLLGWLSFMTRQHYALTLQNRLVRMEMRFRYHLLTGERLESIEEQLGFSRVAALRFASDAELPALVKRALAENLSPKDIKRAIQHWVADDMRV